MTTDEPTTEAVEAETRKLAQAARNETMRKVANQLIGALAARENAAVGDDERGQLEAERLAIRRQTLKLDLDDPDEIDELVTAWSRRVGELRGAS